MTDVIMIGTFPDDPTLIKGGVQASVYGLSMALRKRADIAGIKVISLPIKSTRTALRTVTVEGIEVTYLNIPYRLLASGILHLPRILREIDARPNPVVHVHGTGLLQLAIMAAARLKRIPLVWTLHGIVEKETWMRWRAHRSPKTLAHYLFYRAIERLSLRIVPDIIVDTPYVKEEVQTRQRLYVIPQGIFMQEFAASQAARSAAPLVLSLGVLVPRKGHHITLQAMAMLRTRGIVARLIVAGAPTSPGYYEDLQKQAQELGLDDAVEFAINRPRPEITAMLEQAWVLALHSSEESQGIAFCEALAAGVPVVATRVGGIPFVVDDGKDGLLVEYGDVQAYAGAIGLLLSDAALREQMSQHGKQASRRFDWDSIAAQITAIYRRRRHPSA